MSADSVVAIAWDVLKRYVVVPIERGFRYVMSSKSFADRLQEEVHNLENAVQKVKVLEDQANNNVRKFLDDFTECEQSADKALEEARNLLDAFHKASKTCCHGTLPDPKCRYRFSRKAEPKIEDIKRLAQKCSEFKELDDISFIDPTPGNVADPAPVRGEGKDGVQSATATASVSSASTSFKLRDAGVFESRASAIQKIMEALASDSNSAVGVYGMGGVGKSTLLDEVQPMLSQGKSFHLVAKADVSENPDIKAIQDEIAHWLGLSDIKKEENVILRAKLLRERLEYEEREKKKVLIILDNLWTGLDLKSVGIPCGHDNKAVGCKLLMTARDGEVLRKDMGCDKAFRLSGLLEEEAKILFERIGGDRVHEDDFKALVDKALDKCAGVPFLIVDLAKRFKYADLPQWRDTVKRIEKLEYKGINDLIDRMLLWSYDKLEEEVKRFLWLCVVYGVSKPSLKNLVNYSFGLRIFEGVDNMEDVRDRLSSHISTLQAASFLLDSEDVASLKIHDLVREFVVSKALSDHPLLVLKDNKKGEIELPKDKLKSCSAVCFPYVDINELPEEFDSPDMQIFLLFTNKYSLEVSDSYFNSMKKLMVLHLSQVCLTRSHFQPLENLRTLCLDGCSLEDVAVIGELKGLHVLSFVNSKIERLPKEIGQLVELRLLDLNHCSRLKTIDPGVLESLINLEELYMENSFDRWNAAGQSPPTSAGLIELIKMKNLCTLYASIPDQSMLPENLNVEKLTKYEIQIGHVRQWRWPGSKGSSTLEFKLDPTTSILQKGYIQTLLGKTDDLYFEGLNGIEQSICTLSQEGFPKLKRLHVKNSPSVHYILRQQVSCSSLESLTMDGLPNLEDIFAKESSQELSNLQFLKVSSCKSLSTVINSTSLVKLPKLQTLKVRECDSVQEIFCVDKIGFDVNVETLNELNTINIDELPSLRCIWSKDPCGFLKFHNLKELMVYNCENLEFLFFTSMVHSFARLRELKVWNCKKMEAIIMEEEGSGRETSETLVFSMLTRLTIRDMESLTCFSRKKCSLEARSDNRIESCSTALFNQEVSFPSLESLTMHGLPNLEDIFAKESSQELSNLQFLWVSSCKSLSTVINSTSLVKLPKLQTLTVRECDSVQEIFCVDKIGFDVNVETLNELNTIDIDELPSLRCIWSKDPCGFLKFHNLKELKVDSFENLEFLFFPSMVPSLAQLRELEVSNCEKMEAIIMEDEGSGRETSEILVFSMLTDLTIRDMESLTCFSRKKCSLEAWSENRMKSCSTALFNHEVSFMSLESLTMDGLPNLEDIFAKESSQELSNLQFLCVSSCKSLSTVINSTSLVKLPKLQTLIVRECDSVQEIFCVDKIGFDVNVETLNELNTIDIDELPSLRCIWSKDPCGFLKFHNLKELKVDSCENLEFLFFPSMVPSLAQLRELEVSNCEKMEAIIMEDEGSGRETSEILVFSMLTDLTIRDMESLTCFSRKKCSLEARSENRKKSCSTALFNQEVSFPSLESLTMDGLPNLEDIFAKESSQELSNLQFLKVSSCKSLSTVINSTSLVKLPKLQTLTVNSCENLEFLFFTSMVPSLAQLRELEVWNCKKMEAIIMEEEGLGIEKSETLVFSMLTSLTIRNLESLTCFSRTKCSLEARSDNPIKSCSTALFNQEVSFPSLESLTMDGLPNLEDIFAKESSQELSNLQFLKVSSCKSLSTVINSTSLVKLPKLQTLTVNSCENLEFLFFTSMVPSLAQLRELVVWNCKKMEAIIMEEEGSGTETSETLVFAMLTSLTIHNFESLTCFSRTKCSLEARSDHRVESCSTALFNQEIAFPSLETLYIGGLNKIEILWDNQVATESFHKLKLVSVDSCKKLVNIIPSCILGRLRSLESLEVRSCRSLEVVFKLQPLGPLDGDPVAHFPLKKLKLVELPELKCVWDKEFHSRVKFQFLHSVTVSGCKSLAALFPTSIAEQLTHLEELEIYNCGIVEVIEKEGFVAREVFPRLTSLKLEHLPELKCIYARTHALCWPALKTLRMDGCDKVEILASQPENEMPVHRQPFFLIEKGAFPNLQELKLDLSGLMEMWHGHFHDGEFFCRLRVLELHHLSEESAISTCHFVQSLTNLEELVVCDSYLEKLSTIMGAMEGPSPEGKVILPSSRFSQHLKTLDVSCCNELSNMFTPTIARDLVELTTLRIRNCRMLTKSFVTREVRSALWWLSIN